MYTSTVTAAPEKQEAASTGLKRKPLSVGWSWRKIIWKRPIKAYSWNCSRSNSFQSPRGRNKASNTKISGNEKYKEMIIGTVHSLQGAQCPIVLFQQSTLLKTILFYGAWWKYNMLNVAISRAQHHFIVLATWIFSIRKKILRQGIWLNGFSMLHPTRFPTTLFTNRKSHCAPTTPPFVCPPQKSMFRLFVRLWESKTPPADCISIHIYPCHRKRPADSVDTAYGTTRSWCHNLHRFVPRLWYENKHLLSHAKDGRNALIESGVTLIEVKGIHNKSLAIDNHTLIEGSFNWLSANRHKEYSRHECSIIVSSFQADEYINNLIKELEKKTFQSLSKTTIYLDIDQNIRGSLQKNLLMIVQKKIFAV